VNSDIVVYSPYNKNINPRIITAQRNVFSHLGISLIQVDIGTQSHGGWLDEFMKSTTDDTVVISDIDAFPISLNAFERAINDAKHGAVVGLAQVANHINAREVYAGPMFLAFTSSTYDALGHPLLSGDQDSDVAQQLSRIAVSKNVALSLIYPRFAIKPLWPLASKGVFGIGTFYGDNEFFHLFQSRHARHVDLFEAVAEDACAGQLNFARYLAFFRSNSPIAKMSRELSKVGRKIVPRRSW
jgi:hypothetical protein